MRSQLQVVQRGRASRVQDVLRAAAVRHAEATAPPRRRGHRARSCALHSAPQRSCRHCRQVTPLPSLAHPMHSNALRLLAYRTVPFELPTRTLFLFLQTTRISLPHVLCICLPRQHFVLYFSLFRVRLVLFHLRLACFSSSIGSRYCSRLYSLYNLHSYCIVLFLCSCVNKDNQ